MFIRLWMKIRPEIRTRIKNFFRKILFFISIVFSISIGILLLLRFFSNQLKFGSNLDFIRNLDLFIWGILLIDFFIISNILKKNGLQSVKIFFYVIISLLVENFLLMAENLIPPLNQINTNFNWNLCFWLLFVGLLALGLNPVNEGRIRRFYQLMRDPRSFIAIALGFLISTAFVLIEKYARLAEQLAIYAYYFLVLGVIYQIIVLKLESKNKIEKL